MPTAPNGQFPYPQNGWSTGKMRMSKLDPRSIIDESQGIRSLESEKKRRETEVSGNYTPGTTLQMFPPKKKKQLEKEDLKQNQEEQMYQMSPNQLRQKLQGTFMGNGWETG